MVDVYLKNCRPLRKLQQDVYMACQIPKDASQDLYQPRLACIICSTDLNAVITG